LIICEYNLAARKMYYVKYVDGVASYKEECTIAVGLIGLYVLFWIH